MPSFADLKAKAAGAANSGKDKFNHVRDRNTSVPMKKTNWDPYSGESAPPPPPPRSLVNSKTKPKPLAPLPPPPSRTGSAAISAASSSSRSSVSPVPPPPLPSRSSATPPPPPPRKAAPTIPHSSVSPSPVPSMGSGPPPIVRSTRPDLRTYRGVSAVEPEIDWTNLTPEDKEVFFSWLDEFFANFTPPTTNVKADDTGLLGSSARSHGPPPLRSTNKSSTWASHNSIGNQSTRFVLSHPLPTVYGCGALDLAHYFDPATPWATVWYNPAQGPAIPPPLVGDTNHQYTSSWISRGSTKTIHIGICFSDLSLFWGTIEFSTSGNSNSVTRRAVYLPPPKALGYQELVAAHETYGNTIALFAESFLGTGQYCARGECWDLATEALSYFFQFDYIPRPVQSVSRTHGHLIYEGMARNGGRVMVGRWRGGDDRVRRGDIAEWRRVKIRMKDAPAGSHFTLGDPDHTSIVVRDCVSTAAPVHGLSLLPTDLGVLVVVEQSIGQPPALQEYDLNYFEEGEMWIYRPISMQVYLGVSELTAEPPQGLKGVQHL
ncbi:hypothetical protein BDN70DRAFT_879805 [Pholiota conissans]|uniref:BBC1/AIM3 cysteine proteinase-fold domain-containing protein n=1 Tax=Pholiota conissans TaxID=109636 RepID=A0A9P6CZP3_9AGAR|nr:hypothetical protein BDN70DRAFT_879805 [Pholiota conissans]